LYVKLGRLTEAEAVLRRILEIQLQGVGENSPEVAATMANLAIVSFRLKLPAEAEALYRRALGMLQRSGSDDQKLFTVLSNYAELLRHTGRRGEAKKLEASARAILTTHRSDWGRHTVDVSDLLPSH
jgi:tetratricopeptide (TPR) repeat protein